MWEVSMITWDRSGGTGEENWEVFWKSKPTEHNYGPPESEQEQVSRMTLRFLATEQDRSWEWHHSMKSRPPLKRVCFSLMCLQNIS